MHTAVAEDSSPPPTAFTISPICSPPTAAEVQSYKDLRLTALKTDPSRFASTYERESAFSEETWRARIAGPNRVVLVARASHPERPLAGSVTAIAARELPEFPLPPTAERDTAYFVFAMWVHPSYRRKGVARMLIEALLKWIEENAEVEGLGSGHVEAWLEVKVANGAARRLYEAMGFKEVQETEGEVEEIWLRRCTGEKLDELEPEK